MLEKLLKAIDKCSWLAARLADVVVVVLILSMVYEVGARYVFNAPTIWAFDISYMSTGAIFVLGGAWTLRQDAHVRVDLLSARMSPRLGQTVDGAVFLFLLTPVFGAFAWKAIARAWEAWVKQEVEMVSPWAPLMWPFYSILALGITMLALQLFAEGLRALAGKRVPAEVRE